MNSTLFMPDISGFTKFVKSTESEHSSHIIGELIGIIIEEGKKNFDIAEVEGDAVFFYKLDMKYSVEQVNSFAKSIYNKFHEHLLKYQNKRICNCGACTTAVDLKLKFIVHSGEISLINYVDNNPKPFGEPVIKVHRLLKNKIGLDEYILYSDDFLEPRIIDVDGAGQLEDKELGEIGFKYQLIGEWLDVISVDDINSIEDIVDLVVVQKSSINSDMKKLHTLLVNFEYRHYWNNKIDELIYDPEEINRVGTQHRCIVDGKDLHFDTVKPETKGKQLSYGEILKNPSPFTYFEADYFLTPISENKTELILQMRVNLKNIFQKLISPVFKFFLERQAKKVLRAIEEAIPDMKVAA